MGRRADAARALAREQLHDAGARLGLDGSTVSRRLAALEHRLDQRLFARTRDGLRPTAAAERMRPYAETMEADAAACVRASAAQETRASGVVRLATTEAFARILVSEELLDMRREHPDLVVEVLGGNRPVDLAVRLAALKQASLRVRCELVARAKPRGRRGDRLQSAGLHQRRKPCTT